MEVLQESVLASCSPARSFRALLVNFRKMKTADAPADSDTATEQPWWQEMLHAVAGLCSVALPDMEETAVYSSLTRSGSKTIILIAQPTDPISQSTDPTPHHTGPTPQPTGELKSQKKHSDSGNYSSNNSKSHRMSISATGSHSTPATAEEVSHPASGDEGDTASAGELESSFQEIFSASEASETESVGEDEFSEGRQVFLEACRSRRSQPPAAPGPEESVAGCGCFLRLSDRPGASAVQVLLLAVRHRWRHAGLGSFLLQTMKDPAVVGHYDALLTFADHKAVRFFATHGFSDDPIISARYSVMVDHWENSTLMAYTPPFSGSGSTGSGSTGSIAALSLCEDSFKSWRTSAIASYCEQLSLMQRLRHEVVLLHSKLESREMEVRVLTQQLGQAERDKASMELEFASYRKHTQRLLCEAAVGKAQDWLDSVQDSHTT